MRKLFLLLSILITLSCEAQRVIVGAVQNNYAHVTVNVNAQSNYSGNASTSGLDAQYVGPLNALIYSTYGSGTNTRNSSTQTWQALELNKNNNNDGVNGVSVQNVMGPELVYGKKMSDLIPNRIFNIKVAYNGSSELGETAPNDWKVSADPTLTSTNYTNDVTNSVIPGLQAIVSQYHLIPKIRIIIMFQGEAERNGTTLHGSALQAEWKLQATRGVKQLLDDLNEAGFDTSCARLVVFRIHNHFTDTPDSTDLHAIRLAQMDLGKNFTTDNPTYVTNGLIKGSTYINTDDCSLNGDFVHYDQAGQTLIATRLYNYASQYVYETNLILPPNTSGFDSDAIAYVNATGIKSQSLADAYNTYITGLKSASLWTKIPSIYWSLGGFRRANKVNMKSPGTNDGIFNKSITVDNGYWYGDGTAGYMDTNISFSSLGQNTAGFFFYSNTSGQESQYGNGVIASGNTSRLYWANRWTDDKNYVADNSAAESTGATTTDGSGFHLLTRTASNSFSTYIRGTKATYSVTSVAGDANTFTFGARNVNGTKGGFSTKKWVMLGLLNSSFNDTEESNFRTLTNALITTH